MIEAQNIPEWRCKPIDTLPFEKYLETGASRGPVPSVVVSPHLLRAGQKALRETYNRSPRRHSASSRSPYRTTRTRHSGRGVLHHRESLHDRIETLSQRVGNVEAAGRGRKPVHPRVGQLRFTTSTPPLEAPSNGTSGTRQATALPLRRERTLLNAINDDREEGVIEFPATQNAFHPREITDAEKLPPPANRPSAAALRRAQAEQDKKDGKKRKEREDSIDIDEMVEVGEVTLEELNRIASDPAIMGSQSVPLGDSPAQKDLERLIPVLDRAIAAEDQKAQEAQEGTSKKRKLNPLPASTTPPKAASNGKKQVTQSGIAMTNKLLEQGATWIAQGLNLLQNRVAQDEEHQDPQEEQRSNKSSRSSRTSRKKDRPRGMHPAHVTAIPGETGGAEDNPRQSKVNFKPIDRHDEDAQSSKPAKEPVTVNVDTDLDAFPNATSDGKEDQPVPHQAFEITPEFARLREHFENVVEPTTARPPSVPPHGATATVENAETTPVAPPPTTPRRNPSSSSSSSRGLGARKMSAVAASRSGMIPTVAEIQRANEARSQRALSTRQSSSPSLLGLTFAPPCPIPRQANVAKKKWLTR